MRKFSKDDIERLINDAPQIAPSLINEIYEALEEVGVEGVNILFSTRGKFNPKFKNREAVIGFVVTAKQISGIMLTPEEKAVFERMKTLGK
ncbi:hypothetical protein [Allomuricauda sp. ARW1Y1]|jgi:hypothetical protein|uniref:hypothetical protein n=1 Tax=Allomuricauda sp. ARW1Y1 TaxID=2663843 RepID=UPI0015C8E206|nr:hypothetical protein [Muricauda sp. ARW1Y1]NYJ28238.1 hypothetical protein [Muricauda sp. ARW1Y1]